ADTGGGSGNSDTLIGSGFGAGGTTGLVCVTMNAPPPTGWTAAAVVDDGFALLCADDEHALTAADCRSGCELDVAVVDIPLGEAVEKLVERHAAFEPGEARAEAVVES